MLNFQIQFVTGKAQLDFDRASDPEAAANYMAEYKEDQAREVEKNPKLKQRLIFLAREAFEKGYI